MATLKHSLDDDHRLEISLRDEPVDEDTIEARRARRMAALKKVAGIWSHRADIPADGLDYQRALRSE